MTDARALEQLQRRTFYLIVNRGSHTIGINDDLGVLAYGQVCSLRGDSCFLLQLQKSSIVAWPS